MRGLAWIVFVPL